MRRFLTGLVVVMAAALVPLSALAGNQESAQQIADALKNSGQLDHYKIGVKYQDGTAWLRGQVTSEEQMQTALTLAKKVNGVEHVINNLTVAPAEKDAAAPVAAAPSAMPAEEGPKPVPVVQRVATTFNATPAQPVTATEEPLAPQPAMSMPRMVPAAPATPRPVGRPMPIAYARPCPCPQGGPGPEAMPAGPGMQGGPMPAYGVGGAVPAAMAPAPARFDQPQLPAYAWPSYAAYPNYASVTYPRQYSPTAWPYIGPFYPYPQVPLGWRKVSLEWDDGWWFLDFKDHH